jgi:predicted ATPase
VCVVDDQQWLDPAWADALTFVARRLDAEGIAMLFTSADPTGPPTRDPGLPQLSVQGLERDAADALLVERLGSRPAPRVSDYLWELTRGNPLGLIEISAGLTIARVAGQEPLPDHPKLGDALEHTLLRRIHTLPEPTQTLLLAAADGSGDLGLVLRAAASMGSDH